MLPACDYFGGCASQCNDIGIVGSLIITNVFCVPKSELAVAISAKAPDIAILGQNAGMCNPACNLCYGFSNCDPIGCAQQLIVT
jgi:hypothetical protein